MDLSNTILTFGKHAGKTYAIVLTTDVSYCNWVLKSMRTKTNDATNFQQWLKTKSRKVTCECCNGTGFSDII